MTYRKTWLSYLLWAIYTCTVGVMLANYAILFWQKNINAVIGYGTIIFVFFVFVGVSGIYFGVRKALMAVTGNGEKKLIRRRTAVLGETLAVFGIFLLGTWVRILLYMRCDMGALSITEYYQSATVKAGEQTTLMVHGASYLYTRCLSLVFSFLGNKVAVAVGLQVFLQILSLLLAFFAVRKIAGRIPACMVMLALAVSSFYTEQIFTLTPECLFFVLYLAGLLLIGSYARVYGGGHLGTVPSAAGAVLAGICIGVLAYFDAVSVTLLIMALGIFVDIRLRTDKKRNILLFLVIIATFVVALLGMFAADAYLSHKEFLPVAEAWYALYQSHLRISYVFYRTGTSMIESFILVILSAFLIMSFWNRGKEQNASMWMLLLLILAPTPLAAIGVLPYQIFSVFLWSVLAGIGVQQSFVIPAGVLAIAKRKDMSVTAATPEPMTEAEVKPEAIPVTEAEPNVEAKPEIKTEPRPRFIENPLPLPKKHEKREMGYRFDELAADKLEYDIEVAEDDDFDIS